MIADAADATPLGGAWSSFVADAVAVTAGLDIAAIDLAARCAPRPATMVSAANLMSSDGSIARAVGSAGQQLARSCTELDTAQRLTRQALREGESSDAEATRRRVVLGLVRVRGRLAGRGPTLTGGFGLSIAVSDRFAGAAELEVGSARLAARWLRRLTAPRLPRRGAGHLGR